MSKPEKKGDGVSLKVAMQAYLKAMGMDQKMLELEVLSKWAKLMGDDVDKRTEFKEIKDQVLHLHINSSVMRDELFQMRSVIIKRVNDEAGFEMIRDVFFR